MTKKLPNDTIIINQVPNGCRIFFATMVFSALIG